MFAITDVCIQQIWTKAANSYVIFQRKKHVISTYATLPQRSACSMHGHQYISGQDLRACLLTSSLHAVSARLIRIRKGEEHLPSLSLALDPSFVIEMSCCLKPDISLQYTSLLNASPNAPSYPYRSCRTCDTFICFLTPSQVLSHQSNKAVEHHSSTSNSQKPPTRAHKAQGVHLLKDGLEEEFAIVAHQLASTAPQRRSSASEDSKLYESRTHELGGHQHPSALSQNNDRFSLYHSHTKQSIMSETLPGPQDLLRRYPLSQAPSRITLPALIHQMPARFSTSPQQILQQSRGISANVSQPHFANRYGQLLTSNRLCACNQPAKVRPIGRNLEHFRLVWVCKDGKCGYFLMDQRGSA